MDDTEDDDAFDMDTLTENDVDELAMRGDPRLNDDEPLTLSNFDFPGSMEILFDAQQYMGNGERSKVDVLKSLLRVGKALKTYRDIAYGNPRDYKSAFQYVYSMSLICGEFPSLNATLSKEVDMARGHFPNDTYLMYLALSARIHMGEDEKALRDGQKMLAAYPKDELIHFALSNALRNLGRLEECLDICLKGLYHNPASYALACASTSGTSAALRARSPITARNAEPWSTIGTMCSSRCVPSR